MLKYAPIRARARRVCERSSEYESDGRRIESFSQNRLRAAARAAQQRGSQRAAPPALDYFHFGTGSGGSGAGARVVAASGRAYGLCAIEYRQTAGAVGAGTTRIES